MTRSKLAREIDVIIVTRWKTHAYGCGLAAAERINFSIAREILLPTNLRTLNQVNSRSPSFFLPILVTDRYYILIYSYIYIYTFFFLFTSRIHYTHKYTHIYIFAMTERIEIVGEKKRKKRRRKRKKEKKSRSSSPRFATRRRRSINASHAYILHEFYFYYNRREERRGFCSSMKRIYHYFCIEREKERGKESEIQLDGAGERRVSWSERRQW